MYWFCWFSLLSVSHKYHICCLNISWCSLVFANLWYGYGPFLSVLCSAARGCASIGSVPSVICRYCAGICELWCFLMLTVLLLLKMTLVTSRGAWYSSNRNSIGHFSTLAKNGELLVIVIMHCNVCWWVWLQSWRGFFSVCFVFFLNGLQSCSMNIWNSSNPTLQIRKPLRNHIKEMLNSIYLWAASLLNNDITLVTLGEGRWMNSIHRTFEIWKP